MTPTTPLIILHDYFETAEGGGRLCLTLGRALTADLAYGFKVKHHPYFQTGYGPGHEYGLNVSSRLRVLKQINLIRAFSKRTDFIQKYKTALFSGFYSVCAAANHQRGANVFYCHTPPRFMYDQKDSYMMQAGLLGRPILKRFIRYYRPVFEDAVRRMDLIVTNSRNVQTRIKAFLGFDSEIVYPPCNIERYKFISQEGYYLSMARLDPMKRVDLIVRAFLKMPDKNLVVISDGPEATRIKRLAETAGNVKVLGMVDENRLLKLLGECIATIYIPREEDFGMSPVESMAAGKPILGVNEGGLVESIVHEETGYLIPAAPEIEDVINGITFLGEKKSLSLRENCINRAKKFDQKIFIDRMQKYLNLG